jgi:N-acyl-phosphatidylethanolamine-hydrolysing phospholipase D
MQLRQQQHRNSHSKRSLWHALLWGLGYYDEAHEIQQPPPEFAYPNPEAAVDPSLPSVTWINHSTFLITVNGISLLTDPIWSERCSPLRGVGPKRLHEVPFSLEELPPIHYVLLSHDHYDHLDASTVARLHALYPTLQWMVPTGLASWFRRRGIHNVIELGWWQSHCVKDGLLELSCVPAQHFSGRGWRGQDGTLWCGWVVRSATLAGASKQVYFVGDTGYNPVDFRKIHAQHGAMDLSLIPIGAYRPRAFMRSVHVNPEEAVKIHQEVHSKLSIAGHWNTFRLTSEGREQPPYDLYCAMQAAQLPLETFRVFQPGQTLNWS